MSVINRDEIYRQVAPLLHRDIESLAPGIHDETRRAIQACREQGLDVVINETYRDPKVQELYYLIGRDTVTHAVVDPPTVTNAATAEASWHGYRLALDFKHRLDGYDMPREWWQKVASVCQGFGFAWGGSWHHPDLPHVQPAVLPASPTVDDRADFRRGDLQAVWTRYGIL